MSFLLSSFSGLKPVLAAWAVLGVAALPRNADAEVAPPRPNILLILDARLNGDFVAHVDHTIGEVLRALEQSGLRENTLVIFTSDNDLPRASLP